MSLLQINNAVPLMEPLIEQKTGEGTKRTNRDFSVNRTKFAFLGVITGFFIQVISLGAYAFLLVHYRDVPLELSEDGFQTDAAFLTESGFFRTPTSSENDEDNDAMFGTKTFLYAIVSVLTQIDLIAYVFIWVAFTCTMTHNGMACIRSQFFGQPQQQFDEEDCNKQRNKNSKLIKRRDIFVSGVCFLVGIVLGAFAAWSAIDLYLGFPIPFKPIISTVVVDLMLCYLMVWCYDLGGKKKGNEGSDEDEDCQQEICC